MMSRPKRSAKFGNERWYVTIFVPLLGATIVSHRFRARLDLAVSALLDERRQPPDLQLASDRHQEVGALELQNEARLGLDEVRILVPLCDRLDRDPVAANLAAD